jgi:CheY-like chemotaxis protein/anti-sigma regulatory factor (Ser/Thr protein kinase)
MVKVVEGALDSVRVAADAKGIRLQPVLDSHATIIGDPDRLQQVVWNLLSNAIKFTPKGGRLHIGVHRKESYVEVMVADDGEGIDPAFLPHVFDRFRQADAKISRKSGGLGLGLAIVRSIVELHGGTVTARSDGVGRGATFTVRLPTAPLRAQTAPVPSAPSLAHVATALEAPPAALAGVRILVVDDEDDSRDIIQYVLEQAGARVAVASDAQRALDLLQQSEPQVLISDIGMPIVDGYALIKKVRALPLERGSHVPAVALTAYARLEDRSAALRAGFDMHLTKPVDPAELVVVVATLVETARRRQR